MARMKFLCDAERCIECNACVTACKNEHEVPWGINRRRVVTINDGKPGERTRCLREARRGEPVTANAKASAVRHLFTVPIAISLTYHRIGYQSIIFFENGHPCQ
jgi:ferredoxin